MWRLFDDGSWHDRNDVIVAVGTVHNLEIYGATGSMANAINGIYEPTTDVSSGIVVFQKKTDHNKILEYMGGKLRQWQLKPSDKKGTAAAWATLATDNMLLPHLVFGGCWRVCNEDNWAECTTLKVKLC